MTLEEMQKRLVQLKVRKAVEQARARRLAGERDPAYDPTAGMSSFEKAHTGLWSGYSRGGKGLINLALPDALTPEFASDEALAKQDYEDAALRNTREGFWGGLAGEVASTLPAGGATGTLPKLAANSGRILKMATSTPVRAVAEGAITAAATANPEDRGEAATAGAGIGGALGLASNVFGRLGRGLASRSREADNLDFVAGQHGEKPFIPIAQAVGDEGDAIQRVTKSVYRDALPYVPGVTGQLLNQGKKAGEAFRRVALKEADSLDPNKKVLNAALLANPEAAVPALRKSVSDAFEASVGSRNYTLPVPATRKAMVRGQLRRAYPHIDDTSLDNATGKALAIMERHASGKDFLTGKNLLNAKNDVSDLIKQSKGMDKAALIEVQNMIETQIQRQTPTPQYDLYKRAQEAHANVLALEKSVALTDDFGPTTLARKSRPGTGERHIARTFGRVLKNSVGSPGAVGRRIGQLATGAAGFMNPWLAGGALVAANLAVRPGVQNAVMGNTAVQKALVRALNKDPEARRILGSAARASMTTQVE